MTDSPRTKPQTSTGDFDCLRCALLLTGKDPDDAPEHSHRCPFRDTGRDPQRGAASEKVG